VRSAPHRHSRNLLGPDHRGPLVAARSAAGYPHRQTTYLLLGTLRGSIAERASTELSFSGRPPHEGSRSAAPFACPRARPSLSFTHNLLQPRRPRSFARDCRHHPPPKTPRPVWLSRPHPRAVAPPPAHSTNQPAQRSPGPRTCRPDSTNPQPPPPDHGPRQLMPRPGHSAQQPSHHRCTPDHARRRSRSPDQPLLRAFVCQRAESHLHRLVQPGGRRA